MIRAVIFDMDGTLFDTEALLNKVWSQLVEMGMLPTDFFELLPSLVGKVRPAIRRDILDRFGEDFPVEEMYRKRAELIKRELDLHGVPLKAGIPEVLELLRSRGIRMAIATSTSAPSVEDYMRRTGLKRYFQAIVTGDHVEHGKPAPDCFLMAAREMDCAPEECIVVEDSHNGVRAGAAAGMRVVMIPDVQRPTEEIRSLAWRVCESLSEVPPLVELLNGTAEKVSKENA